MKNTIEMIRETWHDFSSLIVSVIGSLSRPIEPPPDYFSKARMLGETLRENDLQITGEQTLLDGTRIIEAKKR